MSHALRPAWRAHARERGPFPLDDEQLKLRLCAKRQAGTRGAVIDTWTDLSGNSADVVQPTAGQQPTLTVAGMVFDGAATWFYDDTPDLGEVGPELLTNGGFETYTGTQDDGVTDTFTGWTKVNAGTGNIIDATATVPATSAGTNAAKLSGTSTNGILRQYVTVTPGQIYGICGWTSGDGTNAGRYSIYDMTNGANIKDYTSTGVTSATYAYLRIAFTAPAGCTQIRLYLVQPPGGSGNWARFDDLSMRAIYSWSFSLWARRDVDNNRERQYLFCRTTGSNDRAWSLRTIGTGEGAAVADYGKYRFGISVDGSNNSVGVSDSITVAQQGKWDHIVCTYSLGGGITNSYMRIYVNGLLEGTYVSGSAPLPNVVSPLSIARTTVTGSEHYFEGALDDIMFWRKALTPRDVWNEYMRTRAYHPR